MATAYVANLFSNTVSVINTQSNRVIATIPVGDGPNDIAITPNGRRVYVTNFDSNTVSIISTQSNRVIATISVGETPRNIAITPNGRALPLSYPKFGRGTKPNRKIHTIL